MYINVLTRIIDTSLLIVVQPIPDKKNRYCMHQQGDLLLIIQNGSGKFD